jgi:nucleotide-binding universal stress UspA family protein
VKHVLVAVGGPKGSLACVEACARLFADRPPPSVILLCVMQYGGPAAADGAIIDAELAELRETLEGSPQLEELEAKAAERFAIPRKFLEDHGFRDLRTVIRIGRPADEIVAGAAEYGADLIVIGNTRGLLDKLLLGNVTQQVAKAATVPVLLAR